MSTTLEPATLPELRHARDPWRCCLGCSKEFRKPPSNPARFCSSECWYAFAKGANNPRYKGKKQCVCQTCGAQFSVPQSVPGRYCSRKCLGAANGKRVIATRSAKKMSKTCICGATVKYLPSQHGRKKYCSRDCANKAMVKATVYVYGKTWAKQRRKARQRDGHTCQTCGATENLHVHHKIPYRISRSNALSNLITLCASCHTTEEARLRASEPDADTQLSFFCATTLSKLTRRVT